MADKKTKQTGDFATNQFKTIRQAAVPLCGIETADPASTINGIERYLGEKYEETPVWMWDVALSVRPLTKRAVDLMDDLCPNGAAALSNPVECLSQLYTLVKEEAKRAANTKWDKLIFYVHNAHRLMDGQGVSQAIWNLREPLKAISGTLVLLGPIITLPAELKHDVVVISDPLPGPEDLRRVAERIFKDAELEERYGVKVTEAEWDKTTDILRGLSEFAAEQVVAMSLSKTGIDEGMLWQRKKRMIEQTPGLQVWKGGETFEMLGGLSNLKDFLTGLLKGGRDPIRAVLFID